MLKKSIVIIFILIIYNQLDLNAQIIDSLDNKIKLAAYIETYYTKIIGDKTAGYPDFIYSHNRNNEININLGLIKASFTDKKVRANFGLMAGTYTNSNLASEPGVMKNIFEANVGIKLSSKSDLWIDAGVMPSHIGFESAIGKDCWTVTRSILAENSPYYETGAKLSYTNPNGKWYTSIIALNGWQRIQSPLSAVGHQITYKPSGKLTINSSSFIGQPSIEKEIKRFFHNMYAIYQATDKTGIILGFDNGIQKIENQESFSWFSPVFILKYSPNSKWNLSARYEYYEDVNGVIIESNTLNGFKTSGLSFNVDYNISRAAIWRLEIRNLNSLDPIFTINNQPERQLTYITTALAASF